ncbi:MAG: trypsin-like peptidase domain-containing protein [Gemmatimonadetes bacterium]|nr:trypsin-like peptidase domain-containing protein [Gemmatimonadota bacterium]MYG35329.1 trypsin-like peptidase domain-containing protein [Gemmatimonadota bacterium]
MARRRSRPTGPTEPCERYVRLAPLDVEQEMALALSARAFFSPSNYQKSCQTIGKVPSSRSILPLSGLDFMEFLKATELIENPDRYIYQVRHLLERMTANNILVEVSGADSSYVMMPKSYYALSEISTIRSAGTLWLGKTLGGRFLHRQISPAIVQIAGKNAEGEARAGSGLVFDPHHILTCRHVVSEMQVDQTQSFQGREIAIDAKAIAEHEALDVAVLHVPEPLHAVAGLAFLEPFVTQTVYTFGYPRIPCALPTEDGNSPLVVQRGEVTASAVSMIGTADLFLYSAIARPGNSGGALVSDEGYVVGMATDLTEGQYCDVSPFSPHYAGIPAQVISRAVDEMDLGVQVPYETFD